jgi:hypothetical protein
VVIGVRSATREVLSRAGYYLACVGLFEPKDIRDVTVGIGIIEL